LLQLVKPELADSPQRSRIPPGGRAFAAALKKIDCGTAHNDKPAAPASATKNQMSLHQVPAKLFAIQIARSAGNARRPETLAARATQKIFCCIPRSATA
jgi:hypothetical protein